MKELITIANYLELDGVCIRTINYIDSYYNRDTKTKLNKAKKINNLMNLLKNFIIVN